MLDLVILGSGTSVPSPTRSPSGLAVITPDARLLLDCGAGTAQRLLRAGVSLSDLDAVFLSHLHLDHSGDLPSLLFALHNPESPRRSRDLPLLGPRGFSAHLSLLRSAYGDWLDPASCAAPARDLADGDSVAFGDTRVVARRVRHKRECLAFRIERHGAVAVYSGDSGECDELVEAARGADLLVCESSYLEGRAPDIHLTAAAAGRVARRAGARRLVLTHLYPAVDATDVVAAARAAFAGDVVRAEDGMRLTVFAPAE